MENKKIIREGVLYFNRGRWYVGCRGRKTELWAQIVYQNCFLNGEEILKGYEVHHRDGNSENDVPENLELLTKAEHARFHSIGRPATEAMRQATIESNRNRVWSEESRNKSSFSHKGKKLSEEHREKLKGREASEETRQKMSDAHRGKVFSEEHKKKIGDAHRGKIVSEETRKKLSDVNMGKKLSEEHKKKIGEKSKGKKQVCWNKGGTCSDEWKENVRKSTTTWWAEKKKNKSLSNLLDLCGFCGFSF